MKSGGLDLNVIKSVFQDYCEGLQYLHKKNYYVGDFEDYNFAIGDNCGCFTGVVGKSLSDYSI